MTIENKVKTDERTNTNLSKEFGKFLDNYSEENRLCFYTTVKYEQDLTPITIIARNALSDENFGLPVFLKKFCLENKIENLDRLKGLFIDFVKHCRLKHFDALKDIKREAWQNDFKDFDGVYLEKENLTFLKFDF